MNDGKSSGKDRRKFGVVGAWGWEALFRNVSERVHPGSITA